VSVLLDAVNLSSQRRSGRNVDMASTVVLTDTNVSERRDDGGHLRSADGDVVTECPRSVLKRPSRTTSTLRLKCTRQSAVHRLKFIAPSRLTKQPGSGSKQQVRPKGRFTTQSALRATRRGFVLCHVQSHTTSCQRQVANGYIVLTCHSISLWGGRLFIFGTVRTFMCEIAGEIDG